jgi:Bacterial Ig-like domain
MRRHGFIAAVLAALVLGVPLAAADAPAPAIVSSTPASPANNNVPFLNGTAAPLTVVTIYAGSGCSGEIAITGPTDVDGNFTLPVTVGDDSTTTFSANATDGTSTSGCSGDFTYVEDSTPPPAPNLTGPAPISNDSTPTFAFSDDEAGVTFNCRLVFDGAPPGAFPGCSSPVTSDPLVDGSYTFFVKATDAASNESNTTTASFTVDTAPPPSPTVTGPASPSSSTTAHFEFTDGEPNVSYICSLDGPSFAACSNPADFEVGDGTHTLVVEAVDEAGNISAPDPLSTYTWTVDTIHPLVTIDSKPPAVTNQPTATFSFSATGANRYQCSRDGADFSLCTSPQVYPALGDGSHTFAVRTLSVGGTPGAATEYGWIVDTVAPQTMIASGPPSSSQSASATFAFASTEAASTFTCRLDGAGFVPCTSPKTYAGLGDGDHTFSVQAVDQAGNADTSAPSYSWHISGVGPPTQDLRPPANVRNARRNVGYGRLQLHWRNPADADFDHVAVFVSTKRSAPPRTVVYRGRSQVYTNKRFKNGLYYRYLIVSYDRAENAAGGMPVTVPPSVLLKGPGDGRVVHRPPLLRWTPVRRATFYNIQLYYHGQKVLSTWPAKPRQQLSRRWSYGRRFALRRGTYVWYVWPGFGPRAKSRYGQLLGQGTFKVR